MLRAAGIACIPVSAALAQATAAPELVERVMVTGEQPGPGLWKVTRGANILWIAGTHVPVPKALAWKSKRIEDAVRSAQEVLSPPSVSISRSQLGWLTTLTLLPRAMSAPYNPDDKLLRDMVPPPLYARWEVLRDKHLQGYNDTNNEIDRWRPWFAASRLYRAALDGAGLTGTNPMWQRVKDVASAAKVRVTDVRYEPKIDNARAAVKEFSNKPLDDLPCFEKTLARLETDMDAMRARANAWARGNVDPIRKLPEADQTLACNAAFLTSPIAKVLGPIDIQREIELQWLAQAERALSANRVTVAVLPVTRLVAADGYLAALKARGFSVEEPE
ncbi:MAG: TraB/GumN family protein [Betaproteobacteria bacterium]|nr:TraB/GumN family protein [Betaproteobacteria bacterium]